MDIYEECMQAGVAPANFDTKIKKQTLCRDDLVEWILVKVDDTQYFEVHETKHYTIMYLDRKPHLAKEADIM